MLQSAASNAYSWWWASHVRTKQSKWLEQNLQDMGEKVGNVLNLIQEDGDSFAKRAEMYYRKRPELINFVKESYRAYQALAERYEHMSTELQNANNTIATIFPERVQFAMDEDDERKSQKMDKNPGPQKLNIPEVPNFPNRDLKGLLTTATKKLQAKKAVKTAFMDRFAVKSGLSKEEAIEEIDKLQKGILALQTEKEFVKSSYEKHLSKYWDIEKDITERHDQICRLQDEFSVERVIEDDEARNLMATSALKSCNETLISLQGRHEKYVQDSKLEYEKIKVAREKMQFLKNELLPNPNEDESTSNRKTFEGLDQEQYIVTQEKNELESLREKIKEYFEDGSNHPNFTVTEMAEKIDELVNMVISLETAILSHSVLIRMMQTETGELQSHIYCLENNHNTENLFDVKFREMEEKFHKIEELKQNIEDQNNNLQTHFTQARFSVHQLNKKLHSVKPDEAEMEPVLVPIRDDGSVPPEIKLHINPPDTANSLLQSSEDPKLQDIIGQQDLSDKADELNYKEVKSQLCELLSANGKKDEEIQSLRQKISYLITTLDGNPNLLDGQDMKSIIESEESTTEKKTEEIEIMGKIWTTSVTEEKFRMKIDCLLEENLDFWLNFSSSFHQIRKFQRSVQDLMEEVIQLEGRLTKKQDGINIIDTSLKSDARPLYKHLREIETELTLWLEQSVVLKDEMQGRLASLNTIQEEISKALNEESKFTSYQAAKFQGEVLNMRQENEKLAQELQVGLDHAVALQLDIQKTLAKLNEDFQLSEAKNDKNTNCKHSVPLRSFLFGVKPKKQRMSIFSGMHPAFHWKHNEIRAGQST